MTPPSPPPPTEETERRRLNRLRMLAILDTEPEPVFDALVRLAAAVCGKPASLLSLVDAERQWFKANQGLEGRSETQREAAFCDQTIRQDAIFEVQDASRDARFASHPCVAAPDGLRFYAGTPIAMPTGERVGALCVVDRLPGTLSPLQQAALRDLAEVTQWALLQRERLHELTSAGDESRFQSISHASPMGIFQADERGAVFHANGRFQAMLGLPQERALGMGWQDAVDPADRAGVVAGWDEAVRQGVPFDHEFRVLRPDGSTGHLRLQARPGRWGTPERTGFVGVTADITQRKAAEAEAQQARADAEAANRAKSAFLDNVSHEIRTPLNGVLGLMRLLQAEELTPQQRNYVQLADASAASLLDLINDMLDLGKIESGRVQLEDVPFRLDELVNGLGDLYRLRAQEKQLGFTLETAPDLPRTVSGDPGRLRQILNNLLSNALKFTEHGEFGLLVGRADAGRGIDTLLFTVFDTGIGIPFDAQQRLFSHFAQADAATGRRYGGTGLGLAIVKQLCEQMGGTVLLQSEPGRGASFRCELPLRTVREGGTQAPVRERRRTVPAMRILVAEDNPTNQVVIRGLLAQAGHEDVTLVEDGQQALDAAGRTAFDLVLMDCRMPVLDGYAASARLRAAGFTRPIIALTANASAGERERCLAHGMNDYLAKPLDPLQLAQVLEQWSGAEAASGAPAQARTAADSGSFERRQALQHLGGDEELLAVALASFRQHAPQVLHQARDALDAGHEEELHRHLHSLAGSSAMLGARDLQQRAHQLEALASQHRLEAVRAGFAGLETLFTRFLADSAGW